MGHTFSIQPVFCLARALALECLKNASWLPDMTARGNSRNTDSSMISETGWAELSPRPHPVQVFKSPDAVCQKTQRNKMVSVCRELLSCRTVKLGGHHHPHSSR